MKIINQFNKMIDFITSSFVIITTFTTFYISLIAYERVAENADQLNFLFDNWKSNYITDIITIEDKYQCPEGYESMINMKWLGTYEGCY